MYKQPHDEIVRHSTATRWEPAVGYSRAVRAGKLIYVAGTTAVGDNGQIVCVGDPHGQAVRCFEIIGKAVEALGGRMENVVRTRVHITDARHASDVGRAHRECVGANPPASTMVVARLMEAEMLVEIEADVYLPEEES